MPDRPTISMRRDQLRPGMLVKSSHGYDVFVTELIDTAEVRTDERHVQMNGTLHMEGGRPAPAERNPAGSMIEVYSVSEPYHGPGTLVRIDSVDMHGLTGRDPHPPAAAQGAMGVVVNYAGWENADEGVGYQRNDYDQCFHALHEASTYPTGLAPEVHAKGVEAAEGNEPYSTVHYYSVAVAGHGVFDFATYEFHAE